MLIVMQHGASEKQAQSVKDMLIRDGLTPSPSQGREILLIGAIGDDRMVDKERYEALEGVDRVVPILEPYRLAALLGQPEGSRVCVGDVEFGGNEIPLIAGSCSVESEAQFLELAQMLHAQGTRIMRGGAFKPRTSPYSFQGLGEQGLKIMATARERFGMAMVTEVLSEHDVKLVSSYADMLQIGARSMQNYRLLDSVGKQDKPVLLKRGISATIEEWLLAAEYIMAAGNAQVVLCERGIRGYDPSTRFVCDINAIPVLKSKTHLPVILDPSHATGYYHLVKPIAQAGIAAGCDGLIVEVHQNPQTAMSDASQTLNIQRARELREGCARIARAVGRSLV